MSASTGKRGRILIIVENLPVPFDRRVWQEATTLAAAGYEVSVICPKGAEAEESRLDLDGVHIYRHSLPIEAKGRWLFLLEYPVALFHEFRLALSVLRGPGFDVIHACNPPDLIFLIAAVFKPFGKKFVFDHHDICPELYEAKFGRRGLLYWLLRAAERATFALADISIASNESYRHIALTRGGMKDENVAVVRSGPKLERMRALPPAPGERRGRRYLVAYVGVMGQQEGIDLLLEAVRHLVHGRRREDIQFTVVGGGPALAEMRDLANQLGVGPFVHFTGRVPDEELLSVLNTADVCVNPDRANEMNDKSTMNKIVEYMALGKPIVQFDLTEGRYSAGDASLYAKRNDPIDFAEKIVQLLEDEPRRKAMGEIGRARVVGELSWDHEAPKLLEAYQRLFALTGAT